ncbi:hypothetical protein Tco_1391143 [Tanacetum coccineum]
MFISVTLSSKGSFSQASLETFGIKSLLDAVEVTAALIDVNVVQSKLLLIVEVKTTKVRVTAAKQKLVLFSNLNEIYAK